MPLYLKRLDLYGFKSFGVRTRLEFVPGITAVVGPNGSGKSNIADAVRWVLGEQSAKSLRGSCMEDVIFAGSDGKSPLGYADVSLTLDNTDGYIPLDFSEITVTRRVYRSGESEFMINRTRCRLKDIQELFMDTGLGRDSYALIGQGQIDQVLSAKPEERRRIIEEAAGVVKYRARKLEAQRKLRDTEQNLLRVNDIILELEGRIEPLQIEAARAEEYLDITEQLKETELGYFKAQLQELKAQREELGRSAAVIGRDLAALQQDNSRLEHTITQQKGILAAAQEKLEETIVAADGYRQRFSEVQHQRALSEVQLEYTTSQLEEVSKHLERLQASEKELSGQLDALQGELTVVKAEIAATGERQAAIIQTQDEARAAAQDKQILMDQLRRQHQGARVEIEELARVLIGLEERLEHLAQRRLELSQEEREHEREKEVFQQRVAQLTKRYDEETANLARVKEALGVCDQTLQEQRAQLQKTQQARANLDRRLNSLRSRWRVLKEMEEDYEGYSRGVKAVMQAGEKGALRGLIGTVADLLTVPAPLITAVETALGSGLQNIVAETKEAGQKAIEHLKQTKGGRITVLPLDGLRYGTLSQRERDQITRIPGCLGVAAELVRCEDRLAPMREYLLGRVIVTEDLKSAVAVSNELRNFSRIVTLEGDQISPGGAMTGGSPRRQRTGGLLTRKQELEELVVQAQEVKGQLARTDETIAQCLQEMTTGSRNKKLQEQMQHRLVEQAAVQRIWPAQSPAMSESKQSFTGSWSSRSK